jgi:hypothetical protein
MSERAQTMFQNQYKSVKQKLILQRTDQKLIEINKGNCSGITANNRKLLEHLESVVSVSRSIQPQTNDL